MRKIIKLIILTGALLLSINRTLAYYNTSDNFVDAFLVTDYSINISGNGGYFNNPNIIIEKNSTSLPFPTRDGYNFLGFSTIQNGEVAYSTSIKDVDSINNQTLYAKWSIVTYSISYNLNNGNITSPPVNYNVEDTLTLPIPNKTGYTFLGWTGSNGTTPSKNVQIPKGSIGNKLYTANWSKNYYTVNYFVNNNLWAQRTVGYNDPLENLNAQTSLDSYHAFHGWNNWVSNMPNNNVNLYANITEAVCGLTTGHGPWGNASALLQVFKNAGWTGTIIDAASAPGYYMVITDYNLTRAEAENQKNYIASHTNYTNYNYPYLYWVAISCSNGYSAAWTRGMGQSTFK